MTRMINITREKGQSMMEFVTKAAAAKRLADAKGLPLHVAKEHESIVYNEKGVEGVEELESALPSEKDVSAGMVPVVEVNSETKELIVSYVDKAELEMKKKDKIS